MSGQPFVGTTRVPWPARVAAALYGLVAYGAFAASFLYMIGFMGGFAVPFGLDRTAAGPFAPVDLAIDLGLVALFGAQHSVMARAWFKRAWTRIVPPPVERSTYVLIASLILALLFWQWRPLPGVLWDVQSTVGRAVLWTLFWCGWALTLPASAAIDHFELFGLRQVQAFVTGSRRPAQPFRWSGLYGLVRHPILTAFLVSAWSVPRMTMGHAVFAAAMTLYIVIAVRLEERDLARDHAEYERYRRAVPMFFPRLTRRRRQPAQRNVANT